MFKIFRHDIQTVFERDPAAKTVFEVLVAYPGVHALWGHRLTHWLWTHDVKLLARWLSHVFRFLTGIEIHPGATIGPSFFIDHGMGVVIGETAEVGEDVTLYHGVTLGGTSLEPVKRHPTIGDRVVVGAGAKILGPIEIGHDSRIGANAVVVKPVEPHSVVVGVPGQVIKKEGEEEEEEEDHTPDLDHGELPDMVSEALKSLTARLDRLEERVNSRDRSSTKVEKNHKESQVGQK